MSIRIKSIFWKQGPLLPRLLCESNANVEGPREDLNPDTGNPET